MQVEVAAKEEGGFRRKARRRPGGRMGALRFLIFLVCFAGLAHPAGLQAAEWPWSKPDEVSVKCTLDREQIEQGSEEPLGVKAEAADSQEHDLAYAWSVNGGRIVGDGPEVGIDVSGVNPGVYSVAAAVQDAYEHSASCVAHFQIVRPADILTMSCTSESPVVARGEEAAITAEATDSLGHSLRYYWFSNAGRLQGEGQADGAEGQAVRLHTEGLLPGVYTVTGRVEDGWGGASDCIVSVKVEIPPPPPPPPSPPAPQSMAQIIFGVNRQTLEPGAKAQLEKVLARLLEEPTGIVSIESYAGPEEQNPPALSAARGETVKQYLLEKGADESRLQVLVGIGGGRGGLSNRTLDVIWLPVGFQY